MLGEKRNNLLAVGDALGDGTPPVVAEFDLRLIEPDVMLALLQVGVDASD